MMFQRIFHKLLERTPMKHQNLDIVAAHLATVLLQEDAKEISIKKATTVYFEMLKALEQEASRSPDNNVSP